MISVGQIPENFSITDVYELHVDALPSALVGRRALYTELIWDAEGGFQQEWIDGSAVEGTVDDGYTFTLKRRAFSAAGLSLFTVGTASGGGETTLAGDANGPSDANVVTGLLTYPIITDGTPAAGDVLTVQQVGDDTSLVFQTPEETGDATSIQGVPVPTPGPGVLTFDGTDLSWNAASGTGDVIGPSGAVNDRIATFDTTTGKLIKDGGKTIAQVLADAAADASAKAGWRVAVDINFTQLANASISNGSVVLGGKTFTAENIALAADSVQIVNGTGLVFDMNTFQSLTYMPSGTDTGAQLKINLADLIPNFEVGSTEVRVFVDCDGNNATSFEYVFACIRRTTQLTTASRAYCMMVSKSCDSSADLGSNAAARRFFQSMIGAGRMYLNIPVSHELMMLQWSLEQQKVASGDRTQADTVDNATVFAPGNLDIVGRRQESGSYTYNGYNGQNTTGTSYQGTTVAFSDTVWPFVLGGNRNYELCFGCFTQNTLGTLLGTFKRLRVEYKL